MKHLFRLIPAGSYNTAVSHEGNRMKRVYAAAALALILAAMYTSLPVYSQPTPQAGIPSVYARPGGVYTVRGAADAGKLVVAEFTASNGDAFSYNYTAPTTGAFIFDVTLPPDLEADVYTVKIIVGDVVASMSRAVVSKMTPGETLQSMIHSIIRTNEALEAYMAGLRAEGEDVPQVILDGHHLAQEALQEARRHLGDGRYSEALAEARRAQSILQRAFMAAESQPPASDAQPSPEIQRAVEALGNFRKLSERLATNGYNTTALDDALEKIEELVDEAEEKHHQGDPESTRALDVALEAMNRARERIEQLSQQVKTRLASQYGERISHRVEEMRAALNRYQNAIPDQDRARALESLNATEMKLQRLREALQAGRVDMAEIQDLSDDIDEAVSRIGDEAVRDALRDMDRARAWLDAWRNRTGTGSTLSPSLRYKLQSHDTLI